MQDEIESKLETSLLIRFARGCLKMIVAIIIMAIGATYGIGSYTFFGEVFSEHGQGVSGLMLVSFLAGIPISIGILVGFLATRQTPENILKSSCLSSLSVILFVFSAGAILREGVICIVMAIPIFLVLAVMGGILGALMSNFGGSHSSKLLSVTIVLPFLFAPLERKLSDVTAYQTITQTIYITAPPEIVWHHINFPLNIRPSELQNGLAYHIGAPYPIEARTLEGRVGGLRKLRWQRGVEFEAIISTWELNKHIAWNYKFGSKSFPSGSLDEHIVIGGHYFNLESTAYTLTPIGNGTQLSIEVNTSVTTNFNWYADFLARIIVNDAERAFLQFYKNRSESKNKVRAIGWVNCSAVS